MLNVKCENVTIMSLSLVSAERTNIIGIMLLSVCINSNAFWVSFEIIYYFYHTISFLYVSSFI